MSLSGFSDYHVHTPLCRHATGWPSEFAARAVFLGLDEIGFSDHNPMPFEFDDWRMRIEELPHYLEAVEEARSAFPQLTIRLGLECDFLPGHEAWIEKLRAMAEWDYLIGSVHYLPDGAEVDHPQHLSRHAPDRRDELWDTYWKTFGEAVESRLFDFMAHPDLPKKFGLIPSGDLARYYEPAVERLAATATPFEINTAGLRKPVGALYPADRFLKLAADAGVPLLINSDAHAVDELGAGFSEAAAAARSAGFTTIARYSGGVRSFVPIPDPLK
jgi:histidinol-phosphatase (PHP family)